MSEKETETAVKRQPAEEPKVSAAVHDAVQDDPQGAVVAGGQQVGAYAASSARIPADISVTIAGSKEEAKTNPSETASPGETKKPSEKQENIWKEEAKHWREKPWMSSPQGRVAIRLFSRGIMGSLFFAIGGRLADQALLKYDPAKATGNRAHYTQYNKWYHQGVRGIAQFVDKFAGKPIEKLFGTRAVTFRDNRKFNGRWGRSLGHEFVDVAFNFACASVGDGMGRNIASVLDPNVNTEWLQNGRLDIKKLAKGMASSTWRLLTYNSGEDWAVTLPYVYFMKGQRALINKFRPGWEYDFDFAVNGGSYKTGADGSIVAKPDGSASLAKGSYFWEGAIDLQSRFTVYNIGTLMYRETYQNMANRLKKWKDSGFSVSPFASENPDGPKGAFQRLQQFVRYGINSTVRGLLMMTPAVPFFWMFRVPQARFRGMAIDQQTGRPLEHDSSNLADLSDSSPFVKANDHQKVKIRKRYRDITVYRHEDNGTLTPLPKDTFHDYKDSQGNPHTFDPHPKGEAGFMNKWVNTVGRWSNVAAKKVVDSIAEPVGGFSHARGQVLNEFSRTHIHSAFAYTPYFMAKTEFAELWGTTVMKRSVDRVLDGIEHFDGRELKAGIRDFWRAFWRRGDLGEVGYGSVFAETKTVDQLSLPKDQGSVYVRQGEDDRESPAKPFAQRFDDEAAADWQKKEQMRESRAESLSLTAV